MKRFNKTAVALATAGAMSLALVPNASAAEVVCTDSNGIKNTWQTNAEGKPIYSNEQNKGQVATGLTCETPAEAPKDEKAEDKPAGTTTQNATPSATKTPAAAIPVTLKKGDTIRTSTGEVVLTAKYDGEHAVAQPGDHIYDANNVDVSTIRGAKIDPKDGLNKPGEVEDDTAAAIAAALGLSALPLALVIGGVKYILNHDKNGNPVYMEEGKKGQEPTAEDKAASDKLISENADEIKRQAATAEKMGEGVEKVGADAGTAGTTGTDAAAGADRGVNAETGNNTIAKGLVGLLIASIMGAAIFAFGRRRLV